jgi:hypothetical protein
MANLRSARSNPTSPIQVSQVHNAWTATGGTGYLVADARSELLDLGAVLYAGEVTFHESAVYRNDRFTNLTEQVAASDPQWIYDFLVWLRKDGNIKTAPIMGAVHAVHARLQAKSPNSDGWNRKIIADVPNRLSDVKEIAAYWTSKFGSMPMCVKRGLSDATSRLMNEYSYLKYGIQANDSWTIPDIIEMCHAKPSVSIASYDVEDDMTEDDYLAMLNAAMSKSSLYAYSLADRHGNLMWDGDRPYTLKEERKFYFDGLNMLQANRKLRRDFLDNPRVLLNSSSLKAAGVTWNNVLSLAGDRLPKKDLWESLIFAKNIPIGAMIKNLRNMEQAGISREAMKMVCDYISNPAVIAKSHLMPYEIYAAIKNTQSVHWSSALEDALTYSTGNVPELPGRTLILVDASGSMFGTRLSANSTMERVEASAVFAAALALKNAGRVDVYTFSDFTKRVNVDKGMSMTTLVKRIMDTAKTQGSGTRTVDAVRETFGGHDRVVIITDEQSFRSNYGTVAQQVRDETYMYSFDVSGHRTSDIPSGKNRKHQLFGLTDGSFKMIRLLERGSNVGWPWEL